MLVEPSFADANSMVMICVQLAISATVNKGVWQRYLKVFRRSLCVTPDPYRMLTGVTHSVTYEKGTSLRNPKTRCYTSISALSISMKLP